MATMAVDSSSSPRGDAPSSNNGNNGSGAAAGSTPSPSSSLSSSSMPSHNPLPLSASQEAQVRDLYYERVRKQCSDEIKAFAECALGRTFTVVFACREKNTQMNACLKQHATPEAMDAAREEWFARRAERAAERRRTAMRKAEQEKLLRQWWGLEEHDGSRPGEWEDIQAKRRRHEAEQMQRPERIGGFPAKDRPRFDDKTETGSAESAESRS